MISDIDDISFGMGRKKKEIHISLRRFSRFSDMCIPPSSATIFHLCILFDSFFKKISDFFSLACVASVKFLFGLGAKKEEQESKTALKMAQVKERGGGGEKGKKGLQTNPRILKTAHLACHTWVHTSTFDAVISCHNWPIKCLSFCGAEMNFRGACVKPK